MQDANSVRVGGSLHLADGVRLLAGPEGPAYGMIPKPVAFATASLRPWTPSLP